MFELQGIDHVALAVRDVARSAKWYADVLGFEHRLPGMWNGVPVFVGKGTTAIALFAAEGGAERAKKPAGVRVLHLAFRASRSEFLRAQRDLAQRDIPFEFQDHEISHSIYFHDPDGYELEITTYDLEESR